MVMENVLNLQDQLDEITANTRLLVQPERLEVSERAVIDLFQSGPKNRILRVGTKAPAVRAAGFDRADGSQCGSCWHLVRW